ncbi:MAG: N-acetylmuramoyl-L-alanine amidase [Thermoanaerobaculia bacterium]
MKRSSLVVAVLAAVLAVSSLVLRAVGTDVTFVPPDATSFIVRAQDADGKTFIALNECVSALGGSVAYDVQTRSYELKLKQHSAVFGIEAPLVVVDTKIISLSTQVRGDGATAYADPEFFQRVVGPLLGLTFTWDKTGRVLGARKTETAEVTVEATVVDVEQTSKVVLRFSQPPSYAVEKSGDQILLRFPNVHLVSGAMEKKFDNVRVDRIQIHAAEIAIVLKEKGLSSNVYPLGSPPRLVVDIVQARVAAPTPAPGEPAAAPSAGAPPAVGALAPGRTAKTVVLDPGHGGTENGAAGPGGLLEKEATLALVRTIRDTLTRRGYHVVTTRDSDASVGLDDRAATANAAHADVFLSIHCNASRTPAAHGTEVYYLSLDASDRSAAALAENENRVTASPPASSAAANAALRDLDLILWDLAQNQHLAASERLAELIQADFNRLLGITSRGVKQAPFKVLIGVNAPAVLVEVAFVTNPEEEKKLASEDFRRQTAETVAGSLEAFFKRVDAVAPAPRPGDGTRR